MPTPANALNMNILQEMELPVTTPIDECFISLGLLPELFKQHLRSPSLGACAAGGSHEHQGSAEFSLVVNDPSAPGQHGWRWCNKCQRLGWSGNPSPGPCPAGELHDHRGSGDYSLLVNSPEAAGQHGWRWCRKCESLSWAGGPAAGPCPSGGMHDNRGSGEYSLTLSDSTAQGQPAWHCCNKCHGLTFAGQAVTATALRPQIFLVETYRMTTIRTAVGKGPQVGVVNLGPGQQTSIRTTTSYGSSSSSVDTTTVMESQDHSVTANFNQHAARAASSENSEDSQSYHVDGHMHGSAHVGVGSGDVDATLHVEGGANQVRSSASDACENATDNQIAHTDATRNQRVQAGTQSATIDVKTMTETTSVQNNPNPKRTLMIQYFQAVEEYTSLLSLVKVDVAFRSTDPQRTNDRQVPLTDVDSLLGDVLEPPHAARVRERIKRMLQIVLDFEDQPVNVVEEIALDSGKVMLRLKRNLESTYPLKDENGTVVRSVVVDGLLLRVFQRTIRSRDIVSDVTVGKFDAV